MVASFPAGVHAGAQERHPRRPHAPFDQLVERREGDARELPDVHEHVAAADDVAVDDVDRAVVELRVLEAVGGVELAVGAGRVVEQLGQRPQVMVVVEDLVVVPGRSTVPSLATTGRHQWCCALPSHSPVGDPRPQVALDETGG